MLIWRSIARASPVIAGLYVEFYPGSGYLSPPSTTRLGWLDHAHKAVGLRGQACLDRDQTAIYRRARYFRMIKVSTITASVSFNSTGTDFEAP